MKTPRHSSSGLPNNVNFSSFQFFSLDAVLSWLQHVVNVCSCSWLHGSSVVSDCVLFTGNSAPIMWWRYHHFMIETRTLALTLHITSNLRVSSLNVCALLTQSPGVWVLLCSGVQALVLTTLVRAGLSSRIAECPVPSQFAVSFN